jgi:hypothetical protein
MPASIRNDEDGISALERYILVALILPRSILV